MAPGRTSEDDLTIAGNSIAALSSKPAPRAFFALCFSAAISLAAFALASALPAPAQSPSTQSRANPNAGRQIFSSVCAGCHGLDGRGGEHAPNIATRPEVQRLTDLQLTQIVRDGIPSQGMPAFGTTYSAAQIHSVVQYLRSLQGARGSASLPGDPAAGQSIFFGASGCSACHMVSGQGGFIAEDLTDFAAAKSAAEVRTAIVSPADDPAHRDRLATVALKSGAKVTGLVRNEDNFSLQLQSLDGSYHLLDKSGIASLTYDSRSLMPSDYATRLTSKELDDVVSFLMKAAAPAAAARASSPPRKDDDD